MGKLLLCCMCLLALTALLYADLPSANRCRELLKVAKAIIKHINNTHPHSFHVPSDVTNECLGSALTCFRWQVPELHEASGRSKEFFNLVTKLKLSKLHEKKDCIPCSNYTKHKPEEFMNNMKLLLQQIISQEILKSSR